MASEHPLSLAGAKPLVILMRGADDPVTRQWSRLWQRAYPDAISLELELWERPHRNTWINRFNLAIEQAARPVVVVAQGLACAVPVCWADYDRAIAHERIKGALLIDPPLVEGPDLDPRLAAFPALPCLPLPFAALVLASAWRDYPELRALRRLARAWDCPFDTIAENSVFRPNSVDPVQSLGHKFMTRFLEFGQGGA